MRFALFDSDKPRITHPCNNYIRYSVNVEDEIRKTAALVKLNIFYFFRKMSYLRWKTG